MEERLKEVMAEVLNVDAGSIDASTSRDNTAAWDSLGHINLVTALEQEFGFSFEVEEIESMMSFEDVVRVLDTKLAQ